MYAIRSYYVRCDIPKCIVFIMRADFIACPICRYLLRLVSEYVEIVLGDNTFSVRFCSHIAIGIIGLLGKGTVWQRCLDQSAYGIIIRNNFV